MFWGIPTLIENNSIEESINLCKELNFNFVELNMNLPQYQLENIDIEKLNRLKIENNIFYTIHLDENLNVSDFNGFVANAYLKTVLDTIEIAKSLDVKIINMHLSKGVYFTLPDKKVYLFEQYKEKYLGSIASFRNTVEKKLKNTDTTICIENTNGYTNFQLEAIDILLQSPVFALTFDIGHSHCVDNIDEKVVIERENKLYHIHLHDAQDKKDHMTLGTGYVDINKYIQLAEKHNCTIVLETKTVEALKKSVIWLKKNNFGEFNA